MTRLGALVMFTALFLAACGGGGSGSSGAPTPPTTPSTPMATATPAANATSTPTLPPTALPQASTTPTAAASAPSGSVASLVTGRVVDAGNNSAPIVGATVSIGSSFAGGTLSGITATTTTGPDGSYAFSNVAASTPFIQTTYGSFVPSHRYVAVAAGTVHMPDILLVIASSDEQAALVQLNADRVTYGTGVGKSAVALDADAEIVSRYRAQEMATGGWFSHTEPGTGMYANGLKYCAIGAFCFAAGYFDDESICAGAPATLATCEASYISEGSLGGHFQAVVSPLNVWVGFGSTRNGLSYSSSYVGPVDYAATTEIQAASASTR